MSNPLRRDLLCPRSVPPRHLEPRAAPGKILNVPDAMGAPNDRVGDRETEPSSLTPGSGAMEALKDCRQFARGHPFAVI
jgi:hypothetical protein